MSDRTNETSSFFKPQAALASSEEENEFYPWKLVNNTDIYHLLDLYES